jgi:mannose-1-phosphate guanylyltransferase
LLFHVNPWPLICVPTIGMTYKPFDARVAKNRAAVILAGGDGLRLRPFVQRLRGDGLPKQYVKFLGKRSLLEATLQRARALVPSKRQFVVVTESHFDYSEVPRQLSSYPEVQVASQPMNRDTGLGLLLPLAHLYRTRPDATVVLFPSDHFIEEETLFLNHVDAAFALVERDSAKIVLLAIAPTHAETDYGYIVPSNCRRDTLPFGAREVNGFFEKPDPATARKLVRRGGFWNTMVMVFNLSALLAHLRAINPLAYRCFEQISDAVETKEFSDVVNQVFMTSQPFNLSKGLLENIAARRPRSLLVLPVHGVHWSDWGSEERILSTAGRTFEGHLDTRSSSHPLKSGFNLRPDHGTA